MHRIMVSACAPGSRSRAMMSAAVFTFLFGIGTSNAQENVRISSTAYVDYYYHLSSPDAAEEGVNGFTYRRLYLTADYDISESFTARARLEAQGSSIEAFVKDLYLRWTSDGGHRVSFGIMPTPAYDLAEDVWGYRSLEKPILDLFDIVDSRDMGIRADGPIAGGGLVRYAVMAANNEGIHPEEEDDPYKRVYGRLDILPVPFVVSIGGDYAFGDPEIGTTDAARLSGLAAYATDRLSIGLEPFFFQTLEGSEQELYGASLFASGWFSKKWGWVGRFDRVESGTNDTGESVGIAGIAFRPVREVRFIPNVYVTKADLADEARITGRVTLELQL